MIGYIRHTLLGALLTFIAYTTFGQSSIRYDIKIPDPNNDKYTYDLVLKDFSTHNRMFTDHFAFYSEVSYDRHDIDSAFALYGLHVIDFQKSRDPYIIADVEKSGNNNCENAQQLCSNAAVSANSGGPGIQELNGSNHGCLLSNENQSSWFYCTIQTGGVFSFTITPITSSDYDFAVWGPYNNSNTNSNCPPIEQPYRCSYASPPFFGPYDTGLKTTVGGATTQGAGGNGFVSGISASPGQVYIILVDNYSVNNNGFTMSFTGTAVLGCTPVVLPVELIDFIVTYRNVIDADVLEWKTESEFNSQKFILERTDDLDGTWVNIASVPAAGMSTETRNYIHVDQDYKRGAINYYRLSQIDNDGAVYVNNKLVAVDNRNRSKRVLVRAINTLGQEVPVSTSGMLFYIFDDESVERVFNP